MRISLRGSHKLVLLYLGRWGSTALIFHPDPLICRSSIDDRAVLAAVRNRASGQDDSHYSIQDPSKLLLPQSGSEVMRLPTRFCIPYRKHGRRRLSVARAVGFVAITTQVSNSVCGPAAECTLPQPQRSA